MWLKDQCIARLVMEALEQGEVEYRLYGRFAWVIMPNHVHLVLCPLMRTSPNHALDQKTCRTVGQPSPERETGELNRIIRHVERNPVSAGLVFAIEDWPWSSAAGGHEQAEGVLPQNAPTTQS